ncbi:DNA internalization-related competence protein ComEC/Rec2 [Massilia endophytica]|uniref:DNA internalization-related competence protein ComEC/Rec2 n=1 Tax=Massilia endophytica TaxID=2899220 RepID=UPI001E477F6F|nr:DNA internalization-related competence protein ComEC/Rec2 [Massilia endophytica]UGQ48430.1 DNA internalization-related competence protein ComEC/Rec2 [Massilia endophytica]
MRCTVLGFIGGAWLLHTQAELPPYAFPMLLAALPLLWAAQYASGMRHLVRGAAGALLGFGWAAIVAQAALAPSVPLEDEGRDLLIVGTVDSLPNRFSQGERFNFAVERVLTPNALVPPRLALSWYAGFRGDPQPVGDVQPGERWQLKVRLQRPHGNANPYGFDYELWQLEQGVRATGYIRAEGDNRRLDSFVPTLHNVIERCRASLRDRIRRILKDHPYAGVIVALVVGDQRAIDQSDWVIFNRTGISHLISISGLHITMMAGMAAFLTSWFWRKSLPGRRMQLSLILPARKAAAISGMAAALAYVLLAGFGVPAQRTLYMLAVVAVAVWLDRTASISHVLALAAGVVVLFDPWAVMWPGFWLSFGAVAIILYASVGRTSLHKTMRPADLDGQGPYPERGAPLPRGRRLLANLRAAVNTQYAITLGLVPLTMLLFAQISIVSPLANAIAIPLVSLLVTPMALAGSILPEVLAHPLLTGAHELVRGLAAVLEWCSGLRWAVWAAPAPPWWLFLWALFGTLWLLAPRGWPMRWLGLATWLPLLFAEPDHPGEGELRVTAFDVGQGMALLVETSGHRLLYDTGPQYSLESNGGNRVILPYLRARGIGNLDGMVVSHSDSDHVGGAAAILASVQTGWLLSSLGPSHPVAKAAPKHMRCEAGQHWTWDGVRFEVLHPQPDSYRQASLKSNARSCTLRIVAASGTVLLPGDIEAPQEQELLARMPQGMKADVLLAPHHGSGTSSTPAFLAAVSADSAIFQVGHRNRYRHPKPEVEERYRQRGTAILRTDKAGAVTVDIGTGIAVSEYRSEHARYWYGR